MLYQLVLQQQQYSDWYTGHWWVGCYILYSEEGTGRGHQRPVYQLCISRRGTIIAFRVYRAKMAIHRQQRMHTEPHQNSHNVTGVWDTSSLSVCGMCTFKTTAHCMPTWTYEHYVNMDYKKSWKNESSANNNHSDILQYITQCNVKQT